jgi:toxin ParE1/3/4
MSSPSYRLDFSRQARNDLRDILHHSLERWGQEQQERYSAELERGIAVLLDHPGIGRAREDIAPGYRSHPVGQHVILYVVHRRTVRIIRILHSRMDLRRALGGRG